MFDAGDEEHAVTAVERVERDSEVYLRFRDPVKVVGLAKDARTWKPTGLHVRNSSGNVDAQLAKKAQQAAFLLSLHLKAEYQRLAVRDGRHAAIRPAKVAALSTVRAVHSVPTATTAAPVPHTLSLREGIELALDIRREGTYKYHPSERSYGDVAKRLFDAVRILGAHQRHLRKQPITWNELSSVHAQLIWNRMLTKHIRARANGKVMHGPRKAEQTVADLFSVAEWLFRNRRTDVAPRGLDKTWKKRLRQDWARGAGAIGRNARELRYTDPQLAAIFRTASDPRVRLAECLATGRGLGYVADRMRSDVALSTGTRHPFGSVHVDHAANNAVKSPLSRAQQEALQHALQYGYLQKLEQAKCDGRISDFPLFPDADLDYASQAPSIGVLPLLQALPAHGAGVLSTDPRVRLAIEINGEQRLGQCLQIFRSMLQLPTASPDEYARLGDAHLGSVLVPGAVTKPGGLIFLSVEQREAVDHALATYLHEYERNWRELGEDYPLFPPGRLVKGVAVPSLNRRDDGGRYLTATRDALLGWFRELETAAGIEHVPFRSWYGIKRGASDRVKQFTSDDGVRASYSGTSTKMLDDRYNDPRRTREAKLASAIRSEVRGVRK